MHGLLRNTPKIYESQEPQARSKGLGLWRDKNQIKPEIWRKVYK